MIAVDVDYKNVFETLPGRNILLLPDAPQFTIVAVSDGYLTSTRFQREDVEGRGLLELLRDEGFVQETELTASLHEVLTSKKAHAGVTTTRLSDAARRKRRFINKPILSVSHEVLYILHHVSEAADDARVDYPVVSEDARGISMDYLIRQAPVAVGLLRGDEMIIEMANSLMLELWGKKSHIIGLPLLKALPEIVTQPFPKFLERVYQTGETHHGFETEALLKKDGVIKKCYFNYVYAPVKGDDGVITGIMMVASDVTTLVEARKKLEDSEKKFRDLIAKASVATAVYYGENMIVQLANESMLKLWGKDTSVIGKPLTEAVPELSGQPFNDLLKHVFRTGIPYHSTEDRANLMVDGKLQPFYFNFTYTPLKNSEGKIYAILNMAVNVTDTIVAKLKIKEAEERWRVALDSAELGTWDYLPRSHKVTCSERTRELMGFDGCEPAIADVLNAIHVRDRERITTELHRVLSDSSQTIYRLEFEVRESDGRRGRWVKATAQILFDESGKAYKVTGTLMDITERKRIEEALEERVVLRTSELMEANKELERSNQELEQYAYVASHDLQEPLRKILVYTDLLKDGAIRTNAAQEARLEKIMSSASRMSHLIQDLLNFSRLIKTEHVFSRVDLNAVMRNIVDDFELKIEETRANISVNPLPEIEGSAQQMNQLFYNLINNALKFRKADTPPRISISSRRMEPGEVARFEELSQGLTYFDISVGDNGIGFNPKFSRQIFEIFKRLHPRNKYEGTGIGLALCRKIARNHRGEILAESTEGQGSVFHVILPLRQTQ